MRPSAALAWASARLDSPAEARTLVAHVLGVEPRDLVRVTDLDARAAQTLEALVVRRVAGEPVQHLTGRAYFRTVELEVGPGVFIPRPETELLAGLVLEELTRLPGRPRVVELCAGSGAISKALAVEHPGLDQYAVELSQDALGYLRRNLAGTQVTVVAGDMAQAVPELDGTVDVVVVNPPYVPDGVRDALPVDVLRDPDLALFSGPDGLDALRVVARVARRLLKPGALAACEHDDTHALSAPTLFTAAGFVDVADHLDLAGRPRFVTGRQPTGRMAP